MTRRKKRKYLYRSLVLLALMAGLARGWIRGVQASQDGARIDGFTVRIDSGEIGARLDTWTGELTLLDGAGYHWALPGWSEVYRISREPITRVMGGDEQSGDAPRLSVRSADGSEFHFQEVRISLRVNEAGALTYLCDSGTETQLAGDWALALARPILREEFGAYTVQEVSDALTCDAARERASERLAAELERHGIELLEVTASKPSFDRTYELAIAQRKVADQEVERLGEELELKLREREERLTKARAEISMRDELQDGVLANQRIDAETEALKARGATESWAVKRRSDGKARAGELLTLAATTRAAGLQAAEAFGEELAILEGRGAIAIREQLIENLGKTTFKLTPFSQDPSPERVERISLTKADL